ncbi:DUF1127 domain-containing protein [Amaricoccus macauensis]|uniref:DUF1127 domain-containing protein n=1 Tax=Amaricoccus macauensis TaxID=57001 RepID=UPI003C7BC160
MAYASIDGAGVRFGSSRGTFAALKRRFADYRRYRQTLNELEALSDRDLNDIQLSRFSIKEVAWKSVYGE